jgi:hypothetical protein
MQRHDSRDGKAQSDHVLAMFCHGVKSRAVGDEARCLS